MEIEPHQGEADPYEPYQQDPKPEPHLMVVPWTEHFARFPILHTPTPPTRNTKRSLATKAPPSCPKVQQRTREECKLDFRHHCEKPGQEDRWRRTP